MTRPRPRERLRTEPYRFGFFQAVRLLAAARGGPDTVGGPSPSTEAVRVHPDPASVFPASDVRGLAPRDGAPTEVAVGFGGLYGVDAALPASFHEAIATGEAHTRPLRDFLDALGHRSYAQLWRAWARYRPEVRNAIGDGGRHGTRAAALAGGVAEPRLLGLAARLGSWARNAEGLRALLRHATGHPVEVVENVPRRVRLAARPGLGAARLGVDAVAGARVYDESGMFRLAIGPLCIEAFRDLLPGRPGAQRVAALVRLYASDTLDYDVELGLRADDAPPLVLGDPDGARLGRTAFVGRPRTATARRRVRYVPA